MRGATRGCVSLHHRGGHRSSDCKLTALTAVHNLHLCRTDGAAAAERRFGHAPEPLFEQAMKRVPLPPATAARRAPSAKDSPILQSSAAPLECGSQGYGRGPFSTGSSGRRWRRDACFVVEVMGRHCGYLAADGVVWLAAHCIDFLTGELERGSAAGAFIGLVEGKVTIFPIKQLPDMIDLPNRRPLEQWWLELRPVLQNLAQPAAKQPDSA